MIPVILQVQSTLPGDWLHIYFGLLIKETECLRFEERVTIGEIMTCTPYGLQFFTLDHYHSRNSALYYVHLREVDELAHDLLQDHRKRGICSDRIKELQKILQMLALPPVRPLEL
jgi:hypothetical protein